ncbi:hypothetical protein LBMAG49_27390 [Planctomycetota bacterium]|nr:hypothetical protein LBMAG49_27390 [Planctomycetota bacterium]
MMAVREPTQHGFTLIEILLAVAITAMIMLLVGTSFTATLEARAVIEELSESTEAGPRILAMIERDLRNIWTFDVKKNAVLVGRNKDIGSFEADRIDLLTSSDSIGYVLDAQNRQRSTNICEVGYWLKPNPRYRDLMEIWRREDPMIDGDLLTDGRFQLIHDRIKSFKITYFRSLGFEAEELNEWDSSLDSALPRRLKIEFVLERKQGSRNVVNETEIDDFEGSTKTYVRHFTFAPQMVEVMKQGVAMIPARPPMPADPQASGGGGGPAAPGGRGGGRGGDGPGGIPDPTQLAGIGGRGGKGGIPGAPGDNGGGQAGGRGQQQQSQVPSQGPRPQLPPGFNLNDLLRGLGGGGGGLGSGGLGGLFGSTGR